MPITAIYCMCPKGNHMHRKNKEVEYTKKMKDGFTPERCIICHPKKMIFDFGCPNYPYKNVLYMTRESKIALMCAFKRFIENKQIWIPFEIQLLILDYFKQETNPLQIYDEVTKTHFEKCSYCGEKLIEYLDDNSCPHHIIVRR